MRLEKQVRLARNSRDTDPIRRVAGWLLKHRSAVRIWR